jgi:hypothetical protein
MTSSANPPGQIVWGAPPIQVHLLRSSFFPVVELYLVSALTTYQVFCSDAPERYRGTDSAHAEAPPCLRTQQQLAMLDIGKPPAWTYLHGLGYLEPHQSR